MCLTNAGKSRKPDGALPSSHWVKVGVKSLERSDSVVSGGPEKKLFIAAARLSGVSAKVARVGRDWVDIVDDVVVVTDRSKY